MGTYIALLRGINVGGKNPIRMADLKACFEDEGFEDVATYIQSGNVVFRAMGSASSLTGRVEGALTAAFTSYPASVVVRSRAQLRAVVEKAPKGFGSRADHRYDVIFLKEPLTATAAMKDVPANPEVDVVHAGPGCLYYSRLASLASRSRLSKVVSLPIYQRMTIRNWNTTTTLLRMADGG
jgi:uncharacterized protein (DUF1697 family)